jgi:hypothetical protein
VTYKDFEKRYKCILKVLPFDRNMTNSRTGHSCDTNIETIMGESENQEHRKK